MSDCSHRPRNFDWLLKSSGRFSSSACRSYLRNTQLPEDLLRICADHLTRKQRHNNNEDFTNKTDGDPVHGWAFITNDQLNTLCQKAGYSSRNDLLKAIRSECNSLMNHAPVAKKLLDWLGPVHWRAVLEPSFNDGNNGIGICPECGTLIVKNGGCNCMQCFCGCCFDWSSIKLSSKGVARVCRAFGQTRDIHFCKTILKLAERIVSSAIEFSKRRHRHSTRRRPALRFDEIPGILDDIRSERLSNDSDWYNEGEKDRSTRDVLILSEKLINESRAQEGSSPSDLYPSTDDSLSDYSIVSNRDSFSISSDERQWEESSSFSLLSGCDTIHSLDNSNYTGEETAIMSYCKAVKLGISVTKKAQKLNTDRTTTVSTTTSSDYQPGGLVNGLPKDALQKKLIKGQTEHLYSDVSNREDDDDQFILSIYDAAKSGRGGRRSSQFQGNSRQSRRSSWGGWGNQRRSNWSRKRRKEYKNYWQHTTKQQLVE